MPYKEDSTSKGQHYLANFMSPLDWEAYQVHFLSQFWKDYHSYYAVLHGALRRKQPSLARVETRDWPLMCKPGNVYK